ncbi:cellulase family glycosylhydrolase [Haloarcula salinisoli]|uniref:Cellulase family glycosylhydrolase n=1 Tax=Haloarcula salinisoli TaxID=2487746 RepID=A0A8J7YH16_9EURY|nr:cellulase family glycosylhydrolase [Halomicroarcula salinisoli]MBX0305377.1 cellulase family glycosylhydrolase [Halomicroarcula salinisoli]
MKDTRRSFLRAVTALGGLSATGTVVGATETVDAWESDRAYRDGDQVSHEGYVWRAYWYTKGDEPADTVAVWGRVGQESGTDGYPAWTADGVYRGGVRVTHEGDDWEANWWTEGDEPAAESDLWTRIGSSDSSDDEESDSIDGQTPVDRHGQLQVDGTALCDAAGDPVQLRGMSTHGIQWYGWDEFLTPDALDALADGWTADLCRVAMYIQEGGYETDPEGFTDEVNQIVEAVTDRGMYAIIDFHIHDPGDPLENLDHAERFFDEMAAEHADKDNIIFEICNEPNDVDWASVKEYAETIIPIIRGHDSESPIVVGTRGWSSLGLADIGADGPQEIIDNPVEGDNLLYAFHFYAATHGEWERNQLADAAQELPIFVTECGSMEASGDGASDFDSTQAFMDILSDNDISWAFWSYSDDWRTSGIWQEGTTDDWTTDSLTETGEWVRQQIRGQ